tara:strand:- start:481 stop:1272 length:792 start_codon:yes stop_codon:yes gene_type:complete
MKKYLVIGNPISHSLSPKLHNYWFSKANVEATYEKKELKLEQLENIISDLKNEKINGLNVTVPFKKDVISFIDELSSEAEASQSVNTIYKEDGKIFGHNTDIAGFELGLRHINFDIKNKRVLILGAGGVVPSILLALEKLGTSEITLSNRTQENVENLKKTFKNIRSIKWGETIDFDVIINATSIGLKNDDDFIIDYSNGKSGKFFYDVIYNPKKTKFLKKAEEKGNKIENGKMMFIYQAHQSFTLWHKIMPKIDNKTIEFLD